MVCNGRMSTHCHHCHAPAPGRDPRYRRVLWIALALNAAMFLTEIGAGVQSGSVSLLADAVDFAGDAANYGLSLAVLAMGAVARARAAQVKAASMAAFGVLVLGRALWALASGQPPEPLTMGVVAVLALTVNVGVAALLYAWREGDANMRSVWLCTRNDAMGNIAVAAAALGVFGTGSAWPDLLVAATMALLALSAATTVLRQAHKELRPSAAKAKAQPPQAS